MLDSRPSSVKSWKKFSEYFDGLYIISSRILGEHFSTVLYVFKGWAITKWHLFALKYILKKKNSDPSTSFSRLPNIHKVRVRESCLNQNGYAADFFNKTVQPGHLLWLWPMSYSDAFSAYISVVPGLFLAHHQVVSWGLKIFKKIIQWLESVVQRRSN